MKKITGINIKNFLKRVIPLPVRTFMRGTGELKMLLAVLREENALFHKELLQQINEVLQEQKLYDAEQKKMSVLFHKELLQQINEVAQEQKLYDVDQKKMSTSLSKTRLISIDASRNASEAVWAQIFNNSITDSIWLKNRSFSPGRWAVGYPYLYVMYRVLNEARPKRILELGLGQTTRMIAQYAAAFDDVEHYVVEHDQEWIDFFCNDFSLPPNTEIVKLDREMVSYKEAEAVRVFKGFREAFDGKQFDFICIDAPLGSDMKCYSRIDILGLLPDCLSENFVIMLDDFERSGESHTLAEMEDKLKEAKIPYKRGRYSGKKDLALIAAEKIGFLSSM